MERELRKVKLPKSGITAHIIADWTYGERQEIDAALYGAAKTRYEDGQAKIDIAPGVMIEANKKAMLLAVKKLEGKDGDLEVSWDTICSLPADDGKHLEVEVNALSQDTEKK